MTRNLSMTCTISLALLSGCASSTTTPDLYLQKARSSLEEQNYTAARDQIHQYETLSEQTAESLWLGIQAEYQLGNQRAVSGYVEILRTRFPDSPEYQSYLNLLRSRVGH